MSDGRGEAAGDRAPADAEGWFARMRGPDASQWADDLDAWRASDPENDAAYARLQLRWDQSAFLTNTALGRGRDLRRAAIWSGRPAVRYAVIAVSLLLVAAIGVLTMGQLGSPGTPAAIHEYASNDRAVRTVTLADGARVTLDAGAAIAVTDAETGLRVRLIKGRVRFHVARGGAGLVVAAPNGTLVAGEGQFDVAQDDRFVRVVAWREDVVLSGPDGGTTRIASGQQAVFDPTYGVSSLGRAEPGELGWTRGMLSFDRVRLAAAIAAINRYNSRQIEFPDREIGEFRITGAFRVSDPDGFARAVADMFSLPLIKRPSGTIVLTAAKKA
ncbi:FecR family protein [Sphingomonas sp. PP-CE-3G-477]|uniref:FecR family protein n=1 Tax=Sphingomonas sp. PP-CE-3G-477 TaxID=2135660 RepID=UPI000D38EDAD|nr:FecR domain-containing protein [Sphingomonas sp. PP-CE-3G-477]PTQ62868.1 FecR family protein [Sphingomonas sp. PP-CE-3G-477]